LRPGLGPLASASAVDWWGIGRVTMQPPSMMSSIARKYDFLHERAQRRPIREAAIDTTGDGGKKTDIGHLKEFYLQRLAKTEPNVAVRLGAKLGQGGVQPQASGQQVARPTFKPVPATKDIEDLEIMCNNCFNLIKSSEAANCTGDPAGCPIACRNSGAEGPTEKPTGPIALIDLKLKKLRIALEARLRDAGSTVNIMRNLTQLRYHIETAAKWTPGCSEIGALSDHTVQQVKQLTATSRVLAPPVYIFSKRIENVVIQKERELRRCLVNNSGPKASESTHWGGFDESQRDRDDSVADVKSIVSELDSDCGTQYAETTITQDGQGTSDVGNVQDANDYLNLKNEDEQRRWFYAQTLTVKLSLSDKTKARKTLISDLYAKVRQEGVPIDGWVAWIRQQLSSDEEAAQQGGAGAGGMGGGASRLADLDRTVPVSSVSPSRGTTGAAARLSESFPSRAAPRTFTPTSRVSPAPGAAPLLARRQ